ncbi:uncharacterized protein LOC130261368 [Oenanthe melanoleuca]|uniref:uncharacterized protein LOC130261368 n=1 Tax=Oenanthe melanoleuca TaxID=2939378 RepID=UPI0024C14AB2|nr:uncharacterized protein LOC130261368 [Oenanthe melanoleuca]
MRELEKKNEMHAAEMQSQEGRMLPKEQLDIEKETKQQVVDLEAAALKEGRGSTLSAALSKYKIARGALKKPFAFLKGKTCLQAVGSQEEHLLFMSETILKSEKPVASQEKEKTKWPEWSTEPRRTGEQAAGAEGEQLSENSRKAMECVRDVVATSAEDKAEKRESTTDPRRTYEVAPEGRSVERTRSSAYIPDTIRQDVPQSAQQGMPTSAEAAGAEGEQLSENSRKAMECLRCRAATAEDKAEKRESTTDPRRTYEVAPEGRSTRTFRRVFPPDYFTLPVPESVQENTSSSEGEKSSSSSGEQQASC